MRRTIAIFGLEGPGQYWLDAVTRHPGVRLVGLVDSNPDLLGRMRTQGTPEAMLYDSYNDAMERIRPWALICSMPSPWKQSVLRWALREGIHVITDKPLAHTVEQVHWLLESARDSSSVFQVAQNYRLLAGPLVLRRLLRDGMLGRMGNITCRFFRDARDLSQKFYNWQLGWVPLGLEICIHHFDMLRFLLGSDPIVVFGRGWRQAWDWGSGFTAFDALLEFPAGVRVTYHADWSYTGPPTDWSGHWDMAFENGAAIWSKREGLPQVWDREGSLIDPVANDEWYELNCRNRDDATYAILDHLVAAADGQSPPFCPLEDNVRSIGILHAVKESQDRHAPVVFAEFLQRSYGITEPLPSS